MKKILVLAMAVMMSATMFAEKKSVKLFIPGMECAGCQAKVEKVLNYEKGVKKLTVTLEKRTVEIEYDDTKTTVETLQAALEKQLKFKSMVMKEGEQQKTQGCQKSGCGHQCGHSCGHQHKEGDKH